MSGPGNVPSRRRCAIYTRKSSEEGLEQAFNSLHAQREACEAYIQSQRNEGWVLTPTAYDDGGVSGGTMDRPALNALIEAIQQGRIDLIVVYKVDRLSRSLADFVRLIELFDKHGVSFVSVTQQFNTSNSMGRLTLNVLLSFAQFEREVTGERIRDKIAASKKKGMWMGGVIPLGYDVKDKQLVANPKEAKTVCHIFKRYRALGCVRRLKVDLDALSVVSKSRNGKDRRSGGKPFSRGALYNLLKNPLYIGKVSHREKLHHGKHEAIIEKTLWREVQELLLANRRKTKLRTRAKEPSLLSGLLFDDHENPMSPSHATKSGRRYQYYVSQALLQYRNHDAGSVVRVPAQAVEEVVTEELRRLLRNPNQLLGVVDNLDLSLSHKQILIQRGEVLAKEWPSLKIHEQIEYIGKLIQRIIVSRNEIRIRFSRSALASALLADVETKSNKPIAVDAYEAVVPVRLKRCGIETRLIVPNGKVAPAHTSSVEAIQGGLAKALAWNEALVSGTASSMTELAKREKVTQRYIAHLITLAYLAPDIMQSMARGNIPPELSLDRLKKGFPLDWNEQRKTLGFKL